MVRCSQIDITQATSVGDPVRIDHTTVLMIYKMDLKNNCYVANCPKIKLITETKCRTPQYQMEGNRNKVLWMFQAKSTKIQSALEIIIPNLTWLEHQLLAQEGNIQKPFFFLVCYDTKKSPTRTKTNIRCV